MNHWISNLMLAQDAATDVAKKAAEVASVSTGIPIWVVLLSLVALIVLPFVIGQWLANALRVKDMGNRIGMVLFATAVGISPFAVHKLSTDPKNPGKPRQLVDIFHYGIDLAGGTNLVFQVDKAAAAASGKNIDQRTMQEMVSAVKKRINPAGTEEVTVRPVGNDRIEVIVPGADAERTQRIKNQITNLGDLEFCLLANSLEHQEIITQAEQLETSKGTGAREIFRNDKLIAKWREPGKLHGSSEYKDIGMNGDIKSRQFDRNGKSVTEFLVICADREDRSIRGKDLLNTSQGIDDSGSPTVNFQFNSRGGALFGQLTGAHMPREGANGFKTRLAILLNDEVHSAPTINDKISGNGQISGQFSQAEIDELITVLNAGALSVPLTKEPVNEFTISPLLGEDIRKTGLTATLFSMLAVFLITAIYYLKAGVIADICLAFNLLMLLAAMALIDATLTLPGIAGIVLSVAMAVDSNVLIFERMREELAKGSSMRMSIKNGFDKALGTIIDSNVTTLISATVLYYVGTDQVKGFAVTLFIGIVISMFTTVYVARVIFELLERTGRLKTLPMFSIIKQTNFDFVGKTKLFVFGSQVVIALGLLVVAFRGRDNLDIDFRGGAMITFQFEGDQSPPPQIDDVRALLVKAFGESISMEQLSVPGEGGKPVQLFRMRTVIDKEEAEAKATGKNVEAQLRDEMRGAFEGTAYKLLQQSLQLGVASVIPPTTEKVEDAALAREKTFEGGQQFVATVGQALTPGAFAESVREALHDIGGQQKYQEAENLVDTRNSDTASSPNDKAKSIQVRLSNLVSPEDSAQVLTTLKSKLDAQPIFEELTTFASSVAGDTQAAALLALVFAMVAITVYLWFRFSGMTFGIAATIAAIHDVLFTLGAVAVGAYLSGNPIGRGLYLVDFKINLTMIAAFLTIIGYSLNDTIVVFDRIREVRGKSPKITWDMVNISLNQTLSRTLLTSVTTIITSSILYLFGGEGLRGFAYSLTIGILVGTYSSIYIACPTLVWLMNREQPAPKPAGKQLATTAR